MLTVLSIIFILVITGCNNETTEEKIHSHLEEAVALEEDFENQQEEITELEEKEQEIYNQIIDLGVDEIDKINELANEAITVIEDREEKITAERGSIEASEEEFSNIEELINDIDKEESLTNAENMVEVMNQRYESYYTLNDAYMNSLSLEKELYELLQQEDLEQEKLTEQINAVNDSYEKVIEANEGFNEFTVEYNALKREFYESTDLNVTYDEEPEAEQKE
nr:MULTISPECIES: YkyA family protein [unclassified Oceanobacillus]